MIIPDHRDCGIFGDSNLSPTGRQFVIPPISRFPHCFALTKQQWCSIRETVFSWTTARFPFHTSSDRKLKLIGAPIITVTGKAYWDVGHAPKDQSNRRSHLPGYAAWEIHPVMNLTVL
jgi:hypothetical protein